MKYKKWIIAIVLLCGLLYIFLSPIKPDLNGRWTISKLIINGKNYPGIVPNNMLLSYINFNPKKAIISYSGMHYEGKIFEAKIGMPDKRTLIIKSDADTLFNGAYEMTIDTIDNTDHLLTKVLLKSKNKVFEFYKTERCQQPNWPKGIPRGRP